MKVIGHSKAFPSFPVSLASGALVPFLGSSSEVSYSFLKSAEQQSYNPTSMAAGQGRANSELVRSNDAECSYSFLAIRAHSMHAKWALRCTAKWLSLTFEGLLMRLAI